MPKLTLEFNLPEEREEARQAQNGGGMLLAAEITRRLFRNKLKHAQYKHQETYNEVQELQSAFFDSFEGLLEP